MSTTAKTRVLICPYCGDTQPAGERCRVCSGLFEPLSRQASHNAMGPWFVRDEKRPFQPGASYETLVKLIERGQVTRYSIIRSPTTKQFWTVARRVPGLAHLLGYCHNCDATVTKDDHGCPVCGVPFGAYLDRNYLGLPDVKPLPWEAAPENGSVPAAAPQPVADFRRAAEPLGLSSFASDAELRGMTASAFAPPGFAYAPSALATPGVANMAADEAFDDEHATASQASLNALPSNDNVAWQRSRTGPMPDFAARAAQRRALEKRQTIRMLMIGVGVVAVLSFIVIATMIANSRTPPGQETGQQQPEVAQPGAGEKRTTPSAGKSTSPAGEDKPPQPLDIDAPATSIPAGDEQTPPVEGPASVESDHQRAFALLAEARKEDRPLKDRIHDCEVAIGLLKGIKTRSSPAQQPSSITQEIADAEKLLERLKLQEFFPARGPLKRARRTHWFGFTPAARRS